MMSVDEAVRRIVALRKVTEDTGCITRRAQSEILAALSNDVLTEVALKISQLPKGIDSNGTHLQYTRTK
jgi:hypothetical protein